MLYLDEALAELRRITDGIDRDEIDGGWWEPSDGKSFGAGKLAELEKLIRAVA